MKLSEMSWPQCTEIDWSRVLAVLPLGSTEQHGLHLPCSTDALLVSRIAEALEARLPEGVLLLPTQWLGHSPHHLSFGATISVDCATYAALLCAELDSLAGMGCRGALLLNGHGGNRVPAQVALQQMKNRRSDYVPMLADYWSLAEDELLAIADGGVSGMGHAGELETSLMLHLRPDLVIQDQIRDDGRDHCPAGPDYQGYMLRGSPLMWVSNFDQFSETGAFGRATLATKEKGARMFDVIVAAAERLARAILTRI